MKDKNIDEDNNLASNIYKELSEVKRNIWIGSGRLLLAAQQMEEEKANRELKGEKNNEQKENPYTISKI